MSPPSLFPTGHLPQDPLQITHIAHLSRSHNATFQTGWNPNNTMLRFEGESGLISSVPNTLRNVLLRPASLHKMTFFPVPEALVLCHEDTGHRRTDPANRESTTVIWRVLGALRESNSFYSARFNGKVTGPRTCCKGACFPRSRHAVTLITDLFFHLLS